VDALTGQTVSFLNLQDIKVNFWTDLAPLPPGFTWAFNYTGLNDWENTIFPRRAWAVRDGDVLVAVPEPSTVLLLLSGLLPAFLFGKKRKASRQRLLA
jgi:hypothetical protein